MKDRFSGMTPTRIAIVAAAEADVCLRICREVLFKGRPGNTGTARRVIQWAKREGFKIRRPENTTPEEKVAPGTDALLEKVEQRVAGFDSE